MERIRSAGNYVETVVSPFFSGIARKVKRKSGDLLDFFLDLPFIGSIFAIYQEFYPPGTPCRRAILKDRIHKLTPEQKALLDSIKQQMGIVDRNIVFIKANHYGVMGSCSKSHAYLFFNVVFPKNQPPYPHLTSLKHELAHIKMRNSYMSPLVDIIVTVASSIFLGRFIFWGGACIFGKFVGNIVAGYVHQYQEYQADRIALEHCGKDSREIMCGNNDFTMTRMAVAKKWKENPLFLLTHNRDGEFRIKWFRPYHRWHPSVRQRLELAKEIFMQKFPNEPPPSAVPFGDR